MKFTPLFLLVQEAQKKKLGKKKHAEKGRGAPRATPRQRCFLKKAPLETEKHKQMQKKRTPRGVFHKAGFAYRKPVGRCLGAAVTNNMNLTNRREQAPALRQKEYEKISRTPFHTPCPARYSMLHLFDLLSGGNISEMFCYRKT